MANQAQQFDTIGVRGIIGMFFQSLEQYSGQTWINKIANTFESNQDTETYAGLGMVPQMREWVGGKLAKSFIEQSVKIGNRDFEATLAIKNKDRRRDKTGQVAARIGELAQRALSHDALLLSALIDGGTSTTITIPGGGNVTVACYDAQPLFSATHTIGSVALSNSLTFNLSNAAGTLGKVTGTGTPTNPSPAAFSLAIQNALSALYAFKDDQSQPLNEFAREFIIMVPPSLSGSANAAINSAFLALGYSNPLQFSVTPSEGRPTFTVISNPRLTWTDKFALFRTDGAFKTLIRQVEALTPNSANESTFGENDSLPVGYGLTMKVLAEGSDHEFKNNEALFSVEKSGFVGNGRFDQAVLTQFTQPGA
jgi:phage major head subunit gpT-like protein